ncbi:hypothetical protein MNBD_CHLOROFLEXI01-2855 [hydrothermal vent metagenome]|uniref:Cytochrome c domain-containing protein n=1 Tax=hydrothermal vent metagenome TaxID=652676 RepID=A0A3B0VYC6_9ZZZZ
MKLNKMGLFMFAVFLMVVIVACGGEGDTPEAAPPTDVPTAPVGDAINGETLYNTTCIACHGQDGVGIEGLGKSMVDSELIRGLSDEELSTLIKVGRPTSDPENTTGIDMPAKGGNPALSDEGIMDIVAYIRTLQP